MVGMLLNGNEAADMLESNFILLSPHKKSLDFSKLTDEILEACYGYDPDPESLEIRERKKRVSRFSSKNLSSTKKLLKE